jgi:hypothetical protein
MINFIKLNIDKLKCYIISKLESESLDSALIASFIIWIILLIISMFNK